MKTRELGGRGVVTMVAASLLMTLAACSGDAAEGGEAETATSAAEDDGFSISGALAELPGDAEWQWVGVADLSGAVEAAGLEISAEDLTWRSVVAAGLPLEDLKDTAQEDLTYAPALVVLPQLLDRAYQTSVDRDLSETLGWSPLEVETLAHLTGGPTGTDEFVVVDGSFPEDALTGLTDLGDGVWSLGEGEDGQLSPDSESLVLDTIGRPVRMAQDGTQIALSLRTDSVQAWAGGEASPTAADRPELAEPARVLDEAGALSAHFVGAQRWNPMGLALGPSTSPETIRQFQEEWQDRLISEPFSSIAMGHSVREGEATVTIVYRFVAAEGAAAAAPSIESLLAGETFNGSRPISTALTVGSVEVQNNLVVVTGTQPQGTSWSLLQKLVLTAEPPFVLGG